MPFVTELATTNRTSRDSGQRESAPFKVLNGSFVFLGRSLCFERAQVPSLSRPRVLPSRIQTIVARPKFSDQSESRAGTARADSQSASKAARMARSTATCAEKFQCWLA